MKLTKEGQELFDSIKKRYSMTDDAGLLLLKVVCESRDMMQAAEKIVEKEGLVVKDRYTTKAHPAVQIIDKSRGAMFQGLRQLNLDFDFDGNNN